MVDECAPDDRGASDDTTALQRRLQLLHAPSGGWDLQVAAQDLALDEGAATLLGIDRSSGGLLDQLMNRMQSDQRADWLREVTKCCTSGAPFSQRVQVSGPRGLDRVVQFWAEVVNPGVNSVRLAGCVAQVLPGGVEIRLDDFIDMAGEWLWEMDANLRFSYFSPNTQVQLGGDPIEQMLGRSRRELTSSRNDVIEIDMHLNWIAQHKPFRDFRFWRCDFGAGERYISTSGKPIFDASGRFTGYRGTARDLTEYQKMNDELVRKTRQLNAANKSSSDALASLQVANAMLEDQNDELARVQEEVRHQALHDPLTGVGNRRFLDDQLAESAELCRGTDDWLGVLHIDLDRFKQINDTLGHAAGDAVLAHVAQVLEDSATDDDFVARVGGDEFVIVRMSNADQAELGRLAETLIEALSKPYLFEGKECWFGASIGIAAMRGEEIVSDELLMNADIALYRAKNHGRGNFQYFSNEVQQEMLRHKTVSDGILSGLGRGEFIPWYQPQISSDTREILGFEALARWDCPGAGVRPPSDFLDVAEDLGVMNRIDHLILERGLSDLARWDEVGLDIPSLSFNVSAKRLLDDNLMSQLDAFDLPRGRIAFELLESAFLDDLQSTLVWNIDQLKEKGIEIQLDDFGSGHASVVSLVKIGPDTLKIDRQMVSAITLDPARLTVVEAIISIAKALQVKVIAEGVETEEQASILEKLGCEALQGYLFSPPIPAGEVPAFVNGWRGVDTRAQA